MTLPFLRRPRSGATALEFAFIAPVTIGLVIGIIQLGWLIWTIDVLQESAVVGARCMGLLATSCSTGGSYDSAKSATYVQNYAQSRAVTLPTSAFTLNNSTTCGSATGFSMVSVKYSVPALLPAGLGTRFPNSFNLNLTGCYPNQPP